MRVRVQTSDRQQTVVQLEDLPGFLASRRMSPSTMVLAEGSVEHLPADLLFNPPEGYVAVPQIPPQVSQLFIVEDGGRLWGPYREETIRAMAVVGYLSVRARSGPVYTSERWPLYKLMSLGSDFRRSRDRLLANRRHMVVARVVGFYLLLFSIPTWLAGFAGSGEAAATAVLINLASIFIASRSTPL